MIETEISEKDFENLEVGELNREDYVYVKFKKKQNIEFYVGKICPKDSRYGEFQIKFLKRILGTSKLYEDSDGEFDVNEKDIIKKLPKLKRMTGSNRVSGHLWFQVDFHS